MLLAPVEDFFAFPWQGVAGFFAFILTASVLFSKWIPGVRKLVMAMTTWLGGLFNASVVNELHNHITDPEAHGPRGPQGIPGPRGPAGKDSSP